MQEPFNDASIGPLPGTDAGDHGVMDIPLEVPRHLDALPDGRETLVIGNPAGDAQFTWPPSASRGCPLLA